MAERTVSGLEILQEEAVVEGASSRAVEAAVPEVPRSLWTVKEEVEVAVEEVGAVESVRGRAVKVVEVEVEGKHTETEELAKGSGRLAVEVVETW